MQERGRSRVDVRDLRRGRGHWLVCRGCCRGVPVSAEGGGQLRGKTRAGGGPRQQQRAPECARLTSRVLAGPAGRGSGTPLQ